MSKTHHPTAVILCVGLTESIIGDACPRIRDFMKTEWGSLFNRY